MIEFGVLYKSKLFKSIVVFGYRRQKWNGESNVLWMSSGQWYEDIIL